MASPVVAGTAAFLLSYFPNLTAQQLKYIIENSVVKPNTKATNPGSDAQVSLTELSKSGGLLNAFEAVKLAQRISGDGQAVKNAASKQKATPPAKKAKPVKSF
jgi:subtilisin family serine protease